MRHTSPQYMRRWLVCWPFIDHMLVPFLSFYTYIDGLLLMGFYVTYLYLVAMTISFQSQIKAPLYLPACSLYTIKLHSAQLHCITNVNATTTNCCNALCSVASVCQRVHARTHVHTHAQTDLHFGASFNLKSNLALTLICKQTVWSRIFHC